MNLEEALKWTENLVFAKTGQNLYSLQRAILEGTWQGRRYPDIAKTCNRKYDHVRRVGKELWQLMSEELGEKIKQSNFRAAMERHQFSNFSSLVNFGHSNFVSEGSINFCTEHCSYPKPTTNQTTTNEPQKRHDLTEAPECETLHNRAPELKTLKQWILEDNIRIVTIFGLPGIGKTALARELVEQIKDNFHYILWRNWNETLTPKTLQTNLIQFFSQNRQTQQPSLTDYLRSHPALIILDNFQELFTSGELASTYLPDCQNYPKLWQEIGRSPHNSCLLLLSWEQPTEIANLEEENRPCRSLQLGSIGDSATDILADKGLTDEHRWLELIQLYGGNPSWLNIIASTIRDFFNRSVDRFLSYPTLFLGDLEPRLQGYYQRLSAPEKTVIEWLGNQNAADVSSKPPELALSDIDFLKAIQSLKKRSFIENVTDERLSLFAVQPLIKEYVITILNRL
ncbi:MAG: ATP-binding protein [Okeania sp. SIO3I5]|uniref:AAA family ATPase n=1 Tax=Okeania sp. SIO3I5 TaxID=2607805 RepID=UPI0013B70336|nr:ATP-binding protein [Okeania sp. SIO3I5]NEQ36970.1 ATP-binding protein [Okeania sp. SIO3I5]